MGEQGAESTEQGAKKAAFNRVKIAHEIAQRLYLFDRAKYKECFSWINKKIRQERSLALIVRAMKALESRVERQNPPAGNAFEYLEGTLRKLESEEHAARIRSGEPTTILDIFADVLKRAK